MSDSFTDAVRRAWRRFNGSTAREEQVAAQSLLGMYDVGHSFDRQSALQDLQSVMSDKRAQALYTRHAGERLNALIEEVLEDGLLSPEEDALLSAALERYGADLLGPKTVAKLARARMHHHAWYSPLDPVDPGILLKRGEFATHRLVSRAAEERSRTVRVNYGGLTARVRLARGIYYSAGSLAVQRQQENFEHSFGRGELVATNKRLLWVSAQKSISVALNKIVQFQPYDDALLVTKETGKPLRFYFDNDGGFSSVRIGRTIEELR